MRWIGICERAFEMMCRRAVGRQLGGEKTLAHKQIIQAWVAEFALPSTRPPHGAAGAEIDQWAIPRRG